MHEDFMARVIGMDGRQLAAQREALIDGYASIDTSTGIDTANRLINFVDVVGDLKFGHEWPDIRDA